MCAGYRSAHATTKNRNGGGIASAQGQGGVANEQKKLHRTPGWGLDGGVHPREDFQKGCWDGRQGLHETRSLLRLAPRNSNECSFINRGQQRFAIWGDSQMTSYRMNLGVGVEKISSEAMKRTYAC